MSPESERVEILVIGAGYGGVGVGITLLKEGIDDFIIIEAEDDVGGTWRTNRYPGCACDVPSHLYSYSFEPNPEWPQAFSEHADIERYIQHCADKYGVRSKIRFGTRVIGARFDGGSGLWRIETDDGRVIWARLLVPATGGLSRLRYPELKGLESFKGQTVHAALGSRSRTQGEAGWYHRNGLPRLNCTIDRGARRCPQRFSAECSLGATSLESAIYG